jgi:hypothetical protein
LFGWRTVSSNGLVFPKPVMPPLLNVAVSVTFVVPEDAGVTAPASDTLSLLLEDQLMVTSLSSLVLLVGLWV